jgi:hypothetical protein
MVYALIAAKLLVGNYGAASALGWRWGLPLSLLPFAAWAFAAYDVDPDHVINRLWRDEFYGRIIGEGPETADEGAIALLTGVYKMPYYFLLRGAPWSLLSVAGVALLWLRRRDPELRSIDRPLRACALWMLTVLAFFTLSAGKRADYIASVYPASSILAAWALVHVAGSLRRAAWTATIAAAIALGVLGTIDWLEWPSPMPRGYGRSVNAFIHRAETLIASESRPVAIWRLPDIHLATFLGINEPHSTEHLLQMLRRNNRLWLMAGERPEGESTGEIDLEQQSFIERFDLTLTPILSSDDVEGGELWPRRVTLYRVDAERRRRRASD